MDAKIRVIVTLLVIIALFSGLYLFAKAITVYTGYSIGGQRFDDFARCLSANEVILYTSDERCESCVEQRTIFKSSFQYLNVVNCQKEPGRCQDKEIKYGPVWEIKGERYFGVLSLPRLSELTGCSV